MLVAVVVAPDEDFVKSFVFDFCLFGNHQDFELALPANGRKQGSTPQNVTQASFAIHTH